MKILVDAPINSLSLGNVSFNIIKELFEKGHEVGIWPMNEQNIDVSAYSMTEDLNSKFKEAIDRRFDFLSPDIPSIKVWHLNGSENRKNPNQYLYTFYECSQPTDIERKLCNAQNKTIFSSSCSANQFDAEYVPLGLDT